MPAEDSTALINRFLSGLSGKEQGELLAALLDQQSATWLGALGGPPTPKVRRAPRTVRGFQVRLDLRYAKPPIWRRLVLPGDLTLGDLHVVIQAAMGWSNYHLHRFSTGTAHNAPYFLTDFDLEDGEEGISEHDVRLDQVIAEVGDGLWYEYDFGDGWDHVLKVEKVLSTPPTEVQLLTGRRACPPEDVGGIPGYADMVAWVESGYAVGLLPWHFSDANEAREWLPVDWHPAEFDIEAARAELADMTSPDSDDESLGMGS